MADNLDRPQSVEEIVEIVRQNQPLIPRGGGTKPSLFAVDNAVSIVDLRGLSGIVEYLPSEYTITVRSGTTLSELVETLKQNGQYLPFDPPLANAGATIGGTVAAGLSGPGAYRYGPLKDFIIGVRFIDGLGNVVRGGGKVVKNAAGFDFPKLFNGSLGRLGILTEISFKVFPEPKSYVTLRAKLETAQEGLHLLPGLKGFDLEGVEVDSGHNLLLRLGYQEATMDARKLSLENQVGKTLEMILGDSEPAPWESFKSFNWAEPNGHLIKVATHPQSADAFLKKLAKEPWNIHVSNGGKALYLSGADLTDTDSLDNTLKSQNLTGLKLRGPKDSHPLMGSFTGSSFVSRIQGALDPNGIFQSFAPAAAVSAE